MPVALPIKELDLKETWERLEKASAEKHSVALEALSSDLAKSIREGTVTLDAINAFLATPHQVQLDLKEYLLSKKAGLLLHQGSEGEALKYYDTALHTKETPSTWALKGMALLQMERVDEALQAFQKAYLLRENFGPQKQEYLKDLFWVWGTRAFLLGLDAVLQEDSRELQKRVEEFIYVLENAKHEGLEGVMGKLVFREPGIEELGEGTENAEHKLIIQAHETAELKAALEELELAIKLLSIKDPFEGWRAFTKEISKVWPEGVSAVEAIREQRER